MRLKANRMPLRKAAVLGVLIFCGLGGRVAVAQAAAPYMDSSLPLEKRVDDLVSKMTLEEKVPQMRNGSAPSPGSAFLPTTGGVRRCTASRARDTPRCFRRPSAWRPRGIRISWGRLQRRYRPKRAPSTTRRSASNVHSIYFGLTIWSPNINIFRDPRWGRGQETYGEDPFLTSRLGVAFVTGLQGDDPKYFKTVATPKHYAVHSGPESERHRFNVDPSPHDLEDTYLPAFRATVTEGHADSVMCAYNAVDGAPACASKMLLEETLRHDWGFKGYVTSDCGAIDDIYSPRRASLFARRRARLSRRASWPGPTRIAAMSTRRW